MKTSILFFTLATLCVLAVKAQEISAEPPIDSEWYYDYNYGGYPATSETQQAVGYTKVTTLGKNMRYDKEVVAYQMEHVTKFGRTVEEPYYIHYEGPRAYLQLANGDLHLIYDLSLQAGTDIKLSAESRQSVERREEIDFSVTKYDTLRINSTDYIIQEYEPINAVIVQGLDTTRSYSVTQHIGFSHLEALCLLEGYDNLLFAKNGGSLRYYHGGGISYTPQGATSPYDKIEDTTTSFTERPLIYGNLWYVMYTMDPSTDRERQYTDVYHITGEIVKQDSKEFYKVERYFSLDGPDTKNKRYFYLRYDADLGVEYFSGMSYKQGAPGENEIILYDYKTSLGISTLDSTFILARDIGIQPFVCSQDIDNQFRRIFFYQLHSMSEPLGSSPYVWIEGVGWDQGFFPYLPGLMGGTPDILLYAEDQAGRTYGEKRFINTGINAPSRDIIDTPYKVYYDGADLYVETGSLAGFRGELLELYDTNGRLIDRLRIVAPLSQISLDIDVASGIYFWSISSDTGPNIVGKLLIQ